MPYYYQSDYPWCAITCLSMIAKYYGNDVETFEVAAYLNKGPGEPVSCGDYISGKVSMTYGQLLTPGFLPERFTFLVAPDLVAKLIRKSVESGWPVYLVSQAATHAIAVVGYMIPRMCISTIPQELSIVYLWCVTR